MRKRREVSRASGGAHDAVVPCDVGEQLPQIRLLLPAPVGDERLAGPVHGELRAQAHVFLKPVARRLLHQDRRRPGYKRKPENKRDGELDRTRPGHIIRSKASEDPEESLYRSNFLRSSRGVAPVPTLGLP